MHENTFKTNLVSIIKKKQHKKDIYIVGIEVSPPPPSKTPSPLFLAKPPLNQQTVQAPHPPF